MGVDGSRLEGDGALKMHHSVVQLTLFFENNTLGVVRPERDGALIMRHRFVQLTLLLEAVAHIVMSLGVSWPERDGPLIMHYRFIQLTLILKRVSQIEMGIDEIRLEGQRALIMRHRLTGPTQLPQRDAQIVVIDWNIIAESDRLPDQINSSLLTATLIGDDPKQMQSVWLPGVYRQELPVRPFGF
jgi:hypothetical protein